MTTTKTSSKQGKDRIEKNPKYTVHPNLTPRGKDILRRLQNKSLDTTGERSYTLNEEIVNARLKSRHELFADARANQAKINNLQNSLKENAKKQIQSQSKSQTNDTAK